MIVLLLMLAAFAAGMINSVAGGGSFLTFPSLILAGVPSVVANASSTVALVPGSFASGISYRREIGRLDQTGLRSWLLISFAGGALGALLLLFTPDRMFRHLAPWLLLFSTLIFTFGAKVSKALGARAHSNRRLILLTLFPIALYGGYFGGGIGIMFLAAFRLYGLTDIHGMNGIKTILAATLNTVAAVIFIAAHQVAWRPTLLMMVAGIAGGYLGPFLARRIQPELIRVFVIFVGFSMTVYFFRSA